MKKKWIVKSMGLAVAIAGTLLVAIGVLAGQAVVFAQQPPAEALGGPRTIMRMGAPAMPLSPYYIGVALRPVSETLRSHVDLPEGTGIVVWQVGEKSPAAEAGLQTHDILLRADGEKLQSPLDLLKVVAKHSGEHYTQFTLDIVRRGQPETVWVTPAKRPEVEWPMAQPPANQHPELPGVREIRPHFFHSDPFRFDQMPNGVSITVEKNSDGPAHLTVKRGEETWEIEAGDNKTLEQLPKDLRPMVKQLLAKPDVTRSMERMPRELHQQIQRMEEEMHRLQQQMLPMHPRQQKEETEEVI